MIQNQNIEDRKSNSKLLTNGNLTLMDLRDQIYFR